MFKNTVKEEASKELSRSVEEFLAAGGVIKKVKTKKAPKREFEWKGVMGPRMRAGGNNGKTA